MRVLCLVTTVENNYETIKCNLIRYNSRNTTPLQRRVGQLAFSLAIVVVVVVSAAVSPWCVLLLPNLTFPIIQCLAFKIKDFRMANQCNQ